MQAGRVPRTGTHVEHLERNGSRYQSTASRMRRAVRSDAASGPHQLRGLGRSPSSWRGWGCPRSYHRVPGPPTATDPFIAKYICPGGYIPALSGISPAFQGAGLIVANIEILRLHYAETLRAWRERFLANWDKAATIRDERYCRMWEYYLAGAEEALRYQGLVVFQVQLVKRIDAAYHARLYDGW